MNFTGEKTMIIKNKSARYLPFLAFAALFGTALIAAPIDSYAGKKDEAKKAETAKSEDKAVGGIKQGNPVVAVVSGKEIHRAEVLEFIGGLPDQIKQMPLDNLFPLALDQVVNNQIISAKAQQANLEGDPEVTKMYDQAKGQIVRNVFVERQLKDAINQKKLLKAYETMLDKMEKVQETHARHILVDSEDAAKEIITKLDGGAKFEDLAKETKDPSGKSNGGDLGYFAKTEMVPEFADAAFAMDKGAYSKTPVKTQFGWHVIKVEDRRQRPEPEFEAVKPQLQAQVRQEAIQEMLDKWQKEAGIKKFDINGEPMKAAKEEKKKK
jgi:peptidyl-prolyl cis-trans isomerase C